MELMKVICHACVKMQLHIKKIMLISDGTLRFTYWSLSLLSLISIYRSFNEMIR